MPAMAEDDGCCANCADPSWIEGNDLLFCDGCEHKAYHLKCLDPPLKKPPKGEWLCPCCVEMAKALSEPTVAASVKWMAWCSSWHWASLLSNAPDAAKSEMQKFHLHSAHASDHMPPALLNSYTSLCMNASLKALHERMLKDDEDIWSLKVPDLKEKCREKGLKSP